MKDTVDLPQKNPLSDNNFLDIEISNENENQSYLFGDLNLIGNKKTIFYLAISILIITIFFGISRFSTEKRFSQINDSFDILYPKFHFKMNNISKWLSYLIFQCSNLNNSNSISNSNINFFLSAYSHNKNQFDLEKNFTTTSSNPIVIFSLQSLAYDSVEFNIELPKVSKSDKLLFEWFTMNPSTTLFLVILRIILGSILISILILCPLQDVKNHTDHSAKTFEQNLTFFLIIFAILFVHPLKYFQVENPSHFQMYYNVITENLAISYLLFYCFSIVQYFNPYKNIFNIIFSCAVSIIFFVLLILYDIKFIPMDPINLFPVTLKDYTSFNIIHLIMFSFITIGIIIQAIIMYPFSKGKYNKRFIWYFVSFSIYLFMTLIYFILNFCLNIENQLFTKVFPIGIYVSFSLIMYHIHRPDDGYASNNYFGYNDIKHTNEDVKIEIE